MQTEFVNICNNHGLMVCRMGISSKIEGLFRDLLGFELSHNYEVSRECTVQTLGITRGDLCAFSAYPATCDAHVELKNYYQFDLNDIKSFPQNHSIKTSITSDISKLQNSRSINKYFIVLWTSIRPKSPPAVFCKYTDKCAKSTQWASGPSQPGSSFGWNQQNVAHESDQVVGRNHLQHIRIFDPKLADIYIDAILYQV